MNVLITNDDGIFAPGLAALWQALKKDHQVSVVAPVTEQSAVGHSITLVDPIKVKEISKNGGFFGFGLTGTPADCVRIGLAELVRPSPEIVVSGINILYSGTVSAATEAAIMGRLAVAVSLDTFIDPDFSVAADIAARILEELSSWNLPPGVSLNVNVPARPLEDIKGAVFAAQSLVPSEEEFAKRVDPRENIYYWRGKEKYPDPLAPGSDQDLLRQGFVTITPIHHDLTQHAVLSRLGQPNILP